MKSGVGWGGGGGAQRAHERLLAMCDAANSAYDLMDIYLANPDTKREEPLLEGLLGRAPA